MPVEHWPMDQSGAGSLLPGTVLAGRYRIESVIGKGGMGKVYLARVESLGKTVAVKEMCLVGSDHRRSQQAVDQFHQEAKLLANLDHPNLVQVTDYFAESQRHYLVMAYVDGQNLSQKMQARSEAFPLAQVLAWALKLSEVLAYLHGLNPPLIFRDLKPSNIMLDKAGNVRLIDFGIARPYLPEVATGSFLQGIGSTGYSPLEQYQGAGGTDPRSDIYALGATLYHLLTNQAPPSPIELASKGTAAPSVRNLNPDLPLALSALIQNMMALRKEDRPASVQQVQRSLEQIASSLQAVDVTEKVTLGGTDFAYLSEGERIIPIQLSDCMIGRQAPAQLIFTYPQISRQHLRLVRTDRGYTAVDLDSRFGSFLNGRPLGQQPILLQDGDELVLGGVLSLRFFDPSQTREGKRVGRLKGVWIDPDSLDVWVHGQQLSPPLSSAQLALLKLLEPRPGVFVSREQVIQAVWPEAASEGISEEAVDGLIKRVRARLKECGADPIEVRRGQGLRLRN